MFNSKKCVKCGKGINEKKDEWYEVKLFKQGYEDSIIYFHRECYKDFHKDKFREEYQKKVKQFTPVLKNVFGGMKA